MDNQVSQIKIYTINNRWIVRINGSTQAHFVRSIEGSGKTQVLFANPELASEEEKQILEKYNFQVADLMLNGTVIGASDAEFEAATGIKSGIGFSAEAKDYVETAEFDRLKLQTLGAADTPGFIAKFITLGVSEQVEVAKRFLEEKDPEIKLFQEFFGIIPPAHGNFLRTDPALKEATKFLVKNHLRFVIRR